MQFSNSITVVEDKFVDLYTATFSESEGADEGAIIGKLVRNLQDSAQPRDIRVFTAIDGDDIVGGVIFSRLTYSDDTRSVFILSPMAVAKDRQGQGIGQGLIKHALAALKADGADAAITYGDPAFYGKVGFQPLDTAQAASPLPLSMPFGWVGQSLTDAPLLPLKGTCACVDALNDPSLW